MIDTIKNKKNFWNSKGKQKKSFSIHVPFRNFRTSVCQNQIKS